MTPDFMRFVDKWLGVPLCLTLSVGQWLLRPFTRKIRSDQVQRILIVQISERGAVLLGYSAQLKLKEIFPRAELIPDWDWSVPERIRGRLLELLSQKEHTLDEIGLNLDLGASDAIKYCKILEKEGMISRRLFRGNLYFHLAANNLLRSAKT